MSDEDPVKVPVPETPERESYDFVGWFTDAACTESYDFEQELTADLDLYAKWARKLARLTITEKTKLKDDPFFADLSANQGFLYVIEGQADDVTVALTVFVPANGSTSIVNLPVGTYTITELSAWSWRYRGAAQQKLELTEDTSVNFGNEAVNYDWLSCCAFYR